MRKIDIFFPIASVFFVVGIWVMLIFAGCPTENSSNPSGVKDSILITHSSGGFCFICEHERCINVNKIGYLKEEDTYLNMYISKYFNIEFNTTAAVFMEAIRKCSDKSNSAPTPGPKAIPIEAFGKLPNAEKIEYYGK